LGPQNPYAPPREESLPLSVTDLGTPLTREEVQAFVGPAKSGYYWRHWFAREQRHLASSGFNTPAFFLNLWWLLYRKMYREFWIGAGTLIVAEFVMGMLTSQGPHALDLTRALERVIQIVLAVTIGALGNGLYLRRAKIVVAAARARESDEERRQVLIRKAGGTSWVALLTGIVGTVMFGACMVVLADSGR
jgi:hypothetical protein